MRGCASVLYGSKKRESAVLRLHVLRAVVQHGGQATAGVLRNEVACRSSNVNQFDASLSHLVRDEFLDHSTIVNGRRLYKITAEGTAALNAAIADKRVPPLRPLVR